MICLISPVYFLCAILLLLRNTDSKNININIDADDVMKLLNGFIKSDTFKKVADHIIQRSAVRYGGYNNPYHPEDDFITHSETTFDKVITKRVTKQRMKLEADKENGGVEDILEKENNNYMLNKGEDKLEDILTENEHVESLSSLNPKNIGSVKHSTQIWYKKSNSEPQGNTTTAKQLQRRYILKNS